MLLATLLFLLVTVQTGDQYLLQREAASGQGLDVQSRVAVVKPVFTATAYESFYRFYAKYYAMPRGQFVTSDVGLLDHSVVDSWGWSEGLHRFTTSKDAIAHGLVVGRTLTILTDVSVTMGGLFDGYGSRKFDVVILGFTEYVTSEQYYAYKHFVATGGRLILLDATNFLAEVKYHSETQHVSLSEVIAGVLMGRRRGVTFLIDGGMKTRTGWQAPSAVPDNDITLERWFLEIIRSAGS